MQKANILASFESFDVDIIVKEGSFAGKNYYIVPSVMLVEGAFTPAVDSFEQPTALYFDSKDIMESVQSWDGRPISLYHPVGGSTCNTPHILDGQLIGYVFNTRFDSEGNKLRADLWLDKDRGGFIVDKIVQGDKIDLSVGAYGDIINENGTSNGVNYAQRMTSIVGDHLAVLPDVQGACSWSDGCGIRMQDNKEIVAAIRSVSRKPSYKAVETISWEGVGKTLNDYVNGYYKGSDKPDDLPSNVSDLPKELKSWIASKSLLGDANAKTADDLIFFPVVNPSSDKLNEGALQAVLSGRGAQAKISGGAKESAQSMAKKLLNSEFGKKETKMEEKVKKAEVSACEVKEEVVVEKPVTMQDVLATAPKELRGAIADAMREREEQRNTLIAAINGCDKVKFCAKFLDKTETKELKAIASLVDAAKKEKVAVSNVDYSMQSGIEAADKKRCGAPSLF